MEKVWFSANRFPSLNVNFMPDCYARVNVILKLYWFDNDESASLIAY